MDDRAAAISMARAGIATLAEIAALAGVSRQLVRYWVLAEGIDNAKARAAWLAKEWNRRIG